MKTQLLLLVMGILLPAMASAKQVIKKQVNDELEPEDEDDDDQPLDLEKEVFGPQLQKVEGFHILDENLNIILSEPSERVMMALATSNKEENALTLQRVKELYRDQIEKQERERLSKIEYSNKDFENMLAQEKEVEEKKAGYDDSILDRILDYIW